MHWVIEDPLDAPPLKAPLTVEPPRDKEEEPLPPQWINADLRALDISVLGKFDVVVADPPWAIHQEVRLICPSPFRRGRARSDALRSSRTAPSPMTR